MDKFLIIAFICFGVAILLNVLGIIKLYFLERKKQKQGKERKKKKKEISVASSSNLF